METGKRGAGPIVLFDKGAARSLVLGAYSNFLVHSQVCAGIIDVSIHIL